MPLFIKQRLNMFRKIDLVISERMNWAGNDQAKVKPMRELERNMDAFFRAYSR